MYYNYRAQNDNFEIMGRVVSPLATPLGLLSTTTARVQTEAW